MRVVDHTAIPDTRKRTDLRLAQTTDPIDVPRSIQNMRLVHLLVCALALTWVSCGSAAALDDTADSAAVDDPPAAAAASGGDDDDAPAGAAAAAAEEEETAAEEAAAEEAEEAPPPPPPPRPRPPPPPPPSKAQRKPKAVRSAVGGGLLATVGKPLTAIGVPQNAAGPAMVVALGALGVVGAGLVPGGWIGGGAATAAVTAALADEPAAAEPEEVVSKRDNSNDLWLDRQIDKLIDLFKLLVLRK